jgi:hypothetical protein
LMSEQEGAQDKERKELWKATRDGLAANAKSNAEALDRALLTLSSAFLGGSLAFIDKVVLGFPATAYGKPILYLAWLLFGATIVITVMSLMYGVLSFRWLEQALDRFFGQGDQSAWDVSDSTQRAVMRFTWACGVSFIGGIFCLVLFVFINLAGESPVTKPSTPQKAQKGIPNATFFPQQPQSKPADGGTSGSSGTNGTTGTSGTQQQGTAQGGSKTQK